jgi:hypothetical protein
MNDGRVVWFMTVLLLLAGYAGVVRAGDARIAEQRAAETAIAAHVDADELRVRAQPALASERARLRRRLRRFNLEEDEASLVARFVRDAVAIAARDRLRIIAIAAEQTPRVETPASSTAMAGAFAPTPLELTVEGRYDDVLRGLRDLSRAHVLARVELAALTRTHPDGPGATVTAALHVTVERLAPGAGSDVHPGRA